MRKKALKNPSGKKQFRKEIEIGKGTKDGRGWKRIAKDSKRGHLLGLIGVEENP